MPLLAPPVYSGNIRKSTMVRFGGYNHSKSASEGEIYDMKNMSAGEYPILSARGGRFRVKRMPVSGLCTVACGGKRFFFYTDPEKASVGIIGQKIIIMPDKKYIDLSEESLALRDIEIELTQNITVGDGTYAGVNAKLNMISYDGEETPFRVGDGVTISGFGEGYMQNNKTAVIEEVNISGGKVQLIFLENTFSLPEGKTSYSAENITLARKMPDMDYICAHDNRLWGCRKNTIYCSKLGDPFVWNNFQGESGCFAQDVISGGDFTGCISYLGYVIFFKEDMIYKVYGSKPSNYQVISSASLGVKKGSHRSFGVAGEVLFYHSRVGIVAYSGGIPQNISSVFGGEEYKNAVGGSDGVKYYVSMQNSLGEYSLFVYDTEKRLWMKEDDFAAASIDFDDRLYLADSDFIWSTTGNEGDVPEESVDSFVEFGDFYMGAPGKKGISKLQVRAEIEEGSSLSVYISFDGGDFEEVKTLKSQKKRSCVLPIVPRRCDHFRIKLCGHGMWRLYSLSKEYYSGSDI